MTFLTLTEAKTRSVAGRDIPGPFSISSWRESNMIKLTPVNAVAVAVLSVLVASASPAVFAQTMAKPGTGASVSAATSYSPPVEEHKKKPKKAKKMSGMAMPASGG